MKLNWVPVLERRGGRYGSLPKEGKYIRVNKHQFKGAEKPSLTVIISEELMKDLRWVIGDRVEIVHADGLVGVQRVTGRSGTALCPASSGKGSRKKMEGKSVAAKTQTVGPAEEISKFANGQPRIVTNPLIDGSIIIIGEELTEV